MKQYIYHIVDSNGSRALEAYSRDVARQCKRVCSDNPLPGEMPPYKIIRYELACPKVIR